MTNCPYCGGEIPSKDFALRTPAGNYWHFPCADKALDENAALREENDRLQKCYDITNQSWKDLLAKIERLEAVAEAAREVEKFIFPIKDENLVKVIGSDINKLVQALAALEGVTPCTT